jgi:hypothetical protein
MRRVLLSVLTALALTAGRAEAVTVRDLVELSKVGLGDQVLVALIEVDRSVFTLDAATLKQLKDGGVSDNVILAVIRSGRTRTDAAAAAPQPPAPAVADDAESGSREPQVIVIDHHDSQGSTPAPVAYPVAVPVFVPFPSASRRSADRGVTTVIPTDQGLVRARVPVPANCVKAEPVYWGFGGKLRPGSWEPAPTVVCR